MNATLVGRASEQAEIETLVQRARGGVSQPLLIAGEPGSGKTALLHHAVGVAERAGFLVVPIEVDQIDGAVPFAALRLALDALPPATDDEASAEIRAALSRALRDAPAPAAGSPDVHDAFVRLLETWVFRQPVIIAVDDLHAADAATTDLVVSLLRATRNQRVFMAVTMSPGGEPVPGTLADCRRLADDGRLTLLELGALTNGDLAELVEQTLGPDVDPQLIEKLGDVTGGLPFLAVGALRTLADDSISAEPAAAAGPYALPTTRVRSALRYRLAGLGADARRVVEALAVLGDVAIDRRADVGVLANLPGDRVDAGLTRLVHGHVVAVDAQGYRFRHRIVRDAVYDDIGPATRRRWHAEAARLRLDGSADDPGSVIAIARHLEASSGGPDPVAAAILIQAGDLCAHADPRSAADWYRAALSRLGPDEAAAEDARCRLSDALHLSGDHAEAAKHASFVLDTATTAERRGRAAVLTATPWWALGDLARATAMLDAALADPETRSAGLLLHRAELSVWDGRITDARALRAMVPVLGAEDRWLADLVDMHLCLATGRSSDAWQFALSACEHAAPRSAGASATARLSAALAASVDLDPQLAIDIATEVPPEGPMAPWFQVAAAFALRRQGQLAVALDVARRARAAIGQHDVLMFGSHATLIEAGAELGDLRTAEAARADADAARARPGQSLIDAAISHLLVVRGEYGDAGRLLAVAEERERASERVDTLGIVLARRVDAELAASNDDEARAANARLQALPSDESSIAMTMFQLLAAALVDGDGDAASRAHDHAVRFGLAIDAARALGVLGTSRNDVSLVVEAYEQLGRLGAVYRQHVLAKDLRRLGRRVPSRRGAPREITPAERGVARLVAQGLTNRQVAEQASLSPKTVEVYLSRIYAKTGCSSRVELALAVNEGRFGRHEESSPASSEPVHG